MAITYSVGADDRITDWSSDYSKFALMNDGLELTAPSMKGKLLWHFIADDDTRQLYGELLNEVRSGSCTTFNFRCDGPRIRRELQMSITASSGGSVCFTINPVLTQNRDYQPILDRSFRRSADEIPFCSWCNKIFISENNWQEVEEGVQELGLIDVGEMPILDPVTCDACYSVCRSRIGSLRSK